MQASGGRATPPPVPVRKRRLMSRGERQATYGLKVLAIIALSIYLLVGIINFFAAIRTTGLLIVGAVFFAYLIYPLVRRFNRQLPVIWSLLIVYAFIALVAVAVVALLAPPLSNDFQTLAKSIPTLVTKIQEEIGNPNNPIIRRLPTEQRTFIETLPAQIGSLVQTYGFDAAQRTLTVVLSAVSVLGAVIIIPVLSAYLLLDADNLRRQLLGLFPAKRRPKVSVIINQLDGVIGGFIRGQLIDGAIVGLMIFVMLMIMHVPYALLIGVAAAILNFIPYAGAIVGFVPSVILALAYNGPGSALIVAALFAVIQQIDGNFVAPRVLKDAVGLSPVYIIIAILIGSELFGLPGTFLAVPIAAMLRVLREQLLPAPVAHEEAPPPPLTRAPLRVSQPEQPT